METGERKFLTVLWKIENFQPWPSEIASPDFIANSLDGKKFQLRLILKQKTKGLEHAGFCLLVIDDTLDFPIDYEWTVSGSKKSALMSGTIPNNAPIKYKENTMHCCQTLEESDFFSYDTLTVRFCIWRSDRDLSNSEIVSIRTRCEVKDYSSELSVSGFSDLQLNQETTLVLNFGDGVLTPDFRLRFTYKGDSLENAVADFELTPVSIFTPLSIKLELCVLDNKKKEIESLKINEVPFFLDNKDQSCILPKLFSRNALLNLKSDCLENDVLFLCCKISILKNIIFIDKYNFSDSHLEVDSTIESGVFCDASCQTLEKPDEPLATSDPSTFLDASCQTLEKLHEPLATSVASTFLDASFQTSKISVGILDGSLYKEDPLSYLREDLLSLYKEKKLADFELRVGEFCFPVHKNILSARSPVFRAMFSTDMKESKSLDVPDVDSNTLDLMLTYLYVGTVEPKLKWDSALKLYYAADKYQVHSLKQKCSSTLRSDLSVSNVSDVLALADRHQDEELKCFVRDFVHNNFDQVMQSQEWGEFQSHNSALSGNTMLELYKMKLQKKQHLTQPIFAFVLVLLFVCSCMFSLYISRILGRG